MSPRLNAAAAVAASSIASAASFARIAAPPPRPGAEGEQRSEVTFTQTVPIDPLCAGGTVFAPRGPLPVAEPIVTDSPPEGDMPFDLVYTADGAEVAVVHRDTDNVVFFSAATRQVVATVGVGDAPLDVAVSPDNQYVVVPNSMDHTVTVIDRATHTVAATIPITGTQPYRAQVTADSHYAVVGVINDAVTSALSVIDLTTLTEVRSVQTSPQGVIGGFFSPENGIFGDLLTQFDVSPDSRTAVLPNRGSNTVNLYDIITGEQTASIALDSSLPTSVDVSDDGTIAVVGHEGSSPRISKIDMASRTLVGSFPTAQLSEQVIRVTPDNSHAIAAISNNTIFVDLATGTEDARIPTGVVGDIEISFDGQYAFVSNFNARVISIASRSLVATIPFAACVPAATSPTELRAAALNNRFLEDIHFYNINGASSSLEGFAHSGPAPESDAVRDLAISADGRTVLAANNTSANAVIIDLPSRTVRAIVDTGLRPLAAAISPNGRWGLVCNADQPSGGLRGTVSVIDMTTNTVVATVTTNDRPSQVRISPDSQTAYVLTLAGTDMIHFIHLDGAASAEISTALAGQTGSWQGVDYSTVSGIELSADGATLAVCDSFNDNLLIYDTATRALVATVPVSIPPAMGDFPVTVAFNPAGTRAYVANPFSDNLTVINVDGAASAPLAVISGLGDRPFTVDVDATGSYVYVGNYDNLSPIASVKVIDAATNTIVGSVPLDAGGLGGNAAARAAYLSPIDSVLYVASPGGNSPAPPGQLIRINAAGPASSFLSATPLTGRPSSMVFSESMKTAVVAQPARLQDGVDVVAFGPACPPDWNNDGAVNSQDFFDFLNVFFQSNADFNRDGVTNSQDFFDFLNAFFAGC
jgi:YVTN family beta-propeller protein